MVNTNNSRVLYSIAIAFALISVFLNLIITIYFKSADIDWATYIVTFVLGFIPVAIYFCYFMFKLDLQNYKKMKSLLVWLSVLASLFLISSPIVYSLMNNSLRQFFTLRNLGGFFVFLNFAIALVGLIAPLSIKIDEVKQEVQIEEKQEEKAPAQKEVKPEVKEVKKEEPSNQKNLKTLLLEADKLLEKKLITQKEHQIIVAQILQKNNIEPKNDVKNDLVSKIATLKKLKKEGAITEEEYKKLFSDLY